MAGSRTSPRAAVAEQDSGHDFEFDLEAMDLEAAAARGAELELRHPATGVPLGIFLTVCGADSQTYQEALREITEKAQRDGLKRVDASVYERRAAEMAAAIVLDWAYSRRVDGNHDKYERVPGVIPWNREELPFSYENAANVLLKRRWIREQIEAFAGVRANFFRD